jgi:hypothetical protein
MWYEIDHPATWAGLNSFLSGVLNLFSTTFSAVLEQPVLVLFLSGVLFIVVIYLLREMFKTSKK